MYEELLSGMVITRVVAVNNTFSAQNLKGRRQNRQRWALMYKYTGKTAYTCNGKHYLCDAGTVLLVPRGCSYEWVSLEGGWFASMEFDSELIHEEILSFPAPPDFEQAMHVLEHQWRHGGAYARMTCTRDIYTILLKLFKASAKSYAPSDRQRRIQPAVDYMIDHFSENIQNDDLASMTGMSTVYFRKIFTEIYGMPPIAYLNALRIKRAREMLKSDYGSITSVAAALGYSSIYDFSRSFKKHTGLSPSAYIRQKRSGEDSPKGPLV